MVNGVLVGWEGLCHGPLWGNRCEIWGEAKPDNPDMQYLEADNNCLGGLARWHSYRVTTHRHCQRRRCGPAALPFLCCVLCLPTERADAKRIKAGETVERVIRARKARIRSWWGPPVFAFFSLLRECPQRRKRARGWNKAVLSESVTTTSNSIVRGCMRLVSSVKIQDL